MDRKPDQGRDFLSRAGDLSIVIPVYNEAENIAGVLEQIRDHLGTNPEILICYDFEEDTTLPVARRFSGTFPSLKLISNKYGGGCLGAIKSGFQAASHAGVLVMMADLSDDLSSVKPMLEMFGRGSRVVAASRYMRGGKQVGGPFIKRIFSRLAGLSLSLFTGLPTSDPTNNFKLYDKAFLDQIKIESSGGFEIALEITVKAHLAGLPIGQVPTLWRDRTAGESRFPILKWFPKYLRWYWLGISGTWLGRKSKSCPAKPRSA